MVSEVGLLEVEELLEVRVNVEEVTDNDVEENVILIEVEEEEVAGKDVEENVMLPEVEELLDVRVNVEEDVSVELLVVAEVEKLLEVFDVAALLLEPPAGPLPTMAYGEFTVSKDGITKVEMNSATSVDPSPVMSIGL